MTKKNIRWHIPFSAIAYLQKAPSYYRCLEKMSSIPHIPLMGENIMILLNNKLQVLIFEQKYKLLNLI